MSTNIPVVIYCGGQGTRMQEGGAWTKKELVEIGGRPILWHVMRIFSAHGFNHFILPLGYGSDKIKRYFLEYEAIARDFSMRIGDDDEQSLLTYHDERPHDAWRIDFVDTGLETDKASRLRMIGRYISAPRFFLTYGDGLSDVDLDAVVRFHEWHGRKATITGIQPGQYQYGTIEADATGAVTEYNQYPPLPYWINGGFMLLERPVIDMIPEGENAPLETGLLPTLVEDDQVMMYRHHGFWQSMDTYKDAMALETMWKAGAPWKKWA